ncbi:response regulator [Algoriphagus litoralis]|uniref:response regulator n=1 Tax=Algoriphagus litoralis TaxID=2202829 RepID=UPI000DB93905|nr:response regulator transcription factor [Algoriphagus litoralis]
MKILLADDHHILLDGLRFMLRQELDLEEVFIAKTVEEALLVVKSRPIDLVISDISIPEIGGIAFAKLLKTDFPQTRIIFLSMHEEPHLVKDALATGVEGYVLKKNSHLDLLLAIEEVMKGGLFFSPEINRILINRLRFPEDEKVLTEREREVLNLIFDDMTNKEIGEKLFISERTVETHRKNIYQKTKTTTIVGLLKFALENNLIAGIGH